MENNTFRDNFQNKVREIARKVLSLLARWFFMAAIFIAAVFCVLVWERYILHAGWEDAKKQQYINEQARFSFDKAGYKKIVGMMQNRQENFSYHSKFSGRDLFYPEGF